MEILGREKLREITYRDKNYYGKEIRKLGEGTFGEVTKFTIDGGISVAIKTFKNEEDESYRDALREISLLRRCNHPCVMKLIDVVDFKAEADFTLAMVMELGFMSLADSFKTINPAKYQYTISVERVEKTMYQLAAGLSYLHDNDIAHRDLKPGNIVLTRDGRALIADLGASRCGVIKGARYSLPVQTLWWRAPEIAMMQKIYDAKKADVYSLGIIFTELWHGAFIMRGVETPMELIVREAMAFGNISVRAWPEALKIAPSIFEGSEFEDTLKKKNPKTVFDMIQERPTLYKNFQKWEPIILDMLAFNPSKRASSYRVFEYEGFNSLRDPFIEEYADINTKCGSFLDRYALPAQNVNTENPLVMIGELTYTQLTILTRWLYEVGNEYHLSQSTTQHYFYLLALFLDKEKELGYPYLKKSNFQMLGAACVFISSELCETYPVGIDDLVYISDNIFTREQFKGAVAYVLKTVKFDLTFSLPIQYIDILYGIIHPWTYLYNNLIGILLAANLLKKEAKTLAYAAVYIVQKIKGQNYPSCIDPVLSEVRKQAQACITTLVAAKSFNDLKDFVLKLENGLGGYTFTIGDPLFFATETIKSEKKSTVDLKWTTQLLVDSEMDSSRESLAELIKDRIYYSAVARLRGDRVRERKAFMRYFNLDFPFSGKGELVIPERMPSKIIIRMGKIQDSTTVTVIFSKVEAILVSDLQDFIASL